MQKKHTHNRFFLRRCNWQIYASIVLILYGLSQVVTSIAQRNTVIFNSKASLPSFSKTLLDLASEFGVLAMLFGLCLFALIVGLRMVSSPATRRNGC